MADTRLKWKIISNNVTYDPASVSDIKTMKFEPAIDGSPIKSLNIKNNLRRKSYSLCLIFDSLQSHNNFVQKVTHVPCKLNPATNNDILIASSFYALVIDVSNNQSESLKSIFYEINKIVEFDKDAKNTLANELSIQIEDVKPDVNNNAGIRRSGI